MKAKTLWSVGGAAVGVAALVAAVGIVRGDDLSGIVAGCDVDDAVGEYEVSKLDLSMDVQAISSNGEYVLGSDSAPGDDVDAFELWHDGTVSTIDGIPGDGPAVAADVNSSGAVVGVSVGGFDNPLETGWRYQDGQFSTLRGQGGDDQAHPTGINDDGAVVGRYGLYWEPGETTATNAELENPYPDERPSLDDIAQDGTIVGTLGGSEDDSELYDYQAWLWNTDGSGTKIYETEAIDDLSVTGDWAVLTAVDDTPYSYRWKKAEGGQAEEVDIRASSVDRCGRVYGSHGETPAVYSDEIHSLPGLDEPAEWTDPEGDAGHEVTASSGDGSALVGYWKGDPVMWNRK
ncbi:MAG: hypothetical protein ACRDXX_20610 [Stackebrandtia sp.]